MEATEPKTSALSRTEPDLHERVNKPSHVRGYSSSVQVHPLYRTSNQDYGSRSPTVHHLPSRFAALSSRFSSSRLKGGMFVDSGFNTSLDKSRVSTARAPRVHAHLVYRQDDE